MLLNGLRQSISLYALPLFWPGLLPKPQSPPELLLCWEHKPAHCSELSLFVLSYWRPAGHKQTLYKRQHQFRAALQPLQAQNNWCKLLFCLVTYNPHHTSLPLLGHCSVPLELQCKDCKGRRETTARAWWRWEKSTQAHGEACVNRTENSKGQAPDRDQGLGAGWALLCSWMSKPWLQRDCQLH